MSVTFAQRGRQPQTPNTAQIQNMLNENSQLINTIQECQMKGRAQECMQYQQILHRNLVYLASVADSNQNINALLPPPQSLPPQGSPAQHGTHTTSPPATAAAVPQTPTSTVEMQGAPPQVSVNSFPQQQPPYRPQPQPVTPQRPSAPSASPQQYRPGMQGYSQQPPLNQQGFPSTQYGGQVGTPPQGSYNAPLQQPVVNAPSNAYQQPPGNYPQPQPPAMYGQPSQPSYGPPPSSVPSPNYGPPQGPPPAQGYPNSQGYPPPSPQQTTYAPGYGQPGYGPTGQPMPPAGQSPGYAPNFPPNYGNQPAVYPPLNHNQNQPPPQAAFNQTGGNYANNPQGPANSYTQTSAAPSASTQTYPPSSANPQNYTPVSQPNTPVSSNYQPPVVQAPQPAPYGSTSQQPHPGTPQPYPTQGQPQGYSPQGYTQPGYGPQTYAPVPSQGAPYQQYQRPPGPQVPVSQPTQYSNYNYQPPPAVINS